MAVHRKSVAEAAAFADIAFAQRTGFVSPGREAAIVKQVTPGGFTIAASGLQDYVVSPDGRTIYIACADGTVRSYDAQTRMETGAWRIGTDLGGIDITPDGKSIVAVEDRTVFAKYGSFFESTVSHQVYQLDLDIGAVTTRLATNNGDSYDGFFDIATTSNGSAIVSGRSYSLSRVDLVTGGFTAVRGDANNATLRATTSHRYMAVMENNISDAGVSVYKTGNGITATHGGYEDGVQGYNNGVVAIDDRKGLVAQGLGGQVHIYDLALDYRFELNGYKSLGIGQVAGLAFSEFGRTLYILDATRDVIVAVGTEVWEPTTVYALGDVEILGNTYGNGLVASADGTYLTFVAKDGLHVVDITAGGRTLSGTNGADALAGGRGNDVYVVNHEGDTVTESTDAGYDIVRSSIGYMLGDNVEGLTLVGTARAGTGNALANTLTGNDAANILAGLDGDDSLAGGAGKDTLRGNAGNDVLDGGADADRMLGGTGNDRYLVDAIGDRIVEGARAGYDTVEASVTFTLARNVEALLLAGSDAISGTGNALANHLVGNAGDNVLSGLAGKDLIEGGGGGTDRMLGGAGADTFRFVQLDASGASFVEADSIGDFSIADGDVIDLSAIDADVLTAGDQAFTFTGAGTFGGKAGELGLVVYQGDTYLQADVNGDKLIDFVIRLDGRIEITAADFLL